MILCRYAVVFVVFLISVEATGADSRTYRTGKTGFRHRDTGDWFPATIKISNTHVIVCERNTLLKIASFDSGFVQTGMHKLSNKKDIAILNAFPIVAVSLTGEDTKEALTFAAVYSLFSIMTTYLLSSRDHVHFVLSNEKEKYKIHVRVPKKKSMDFKRMVEKIMEPIP